MTRRIHVIFMTFTTLAVAFAIGWGFYLVGSPNNRRLDRLDERRLRDLQAIVYQIQVMVVDQRNEKRWVVKNPLPKTLEEAAERSRDEKLNFHDPETGEQYRFLLKSETTYELCATFSRKLDSDVKIFWNHPVGAHCYTINVLDPP